MAGVPKNKREKAMPTTAEEMRAAAEQRFARVALPPGQERKFPVGSASARELG
jgi:hypothetical protein